MKRHCKVQDNMSGNGLGNRCSIENGFHGLGRAS